MKRKLVGFYYRCSSIIFLWAFLPLIGLMSLSSSAFALQSEYFTYEVSGGTVTITGYTGGAGVVVIPAAIDGMPVVTIGNYSFKNIKYLTSVTIPDSVTSIGAEAFRGCTGLTSVTIPDSVTSIGILAFDYCAGLTSVTIGNSVTSIGVWAFLECYNLTSIAVDPNNTAYSSQDGVLYNKAKTVLIQCPGGKSGGFTIPDGVTSIEKNAFSSCTGLTSVTIPNSVTTIVREAFSGCSGLTSVTIPASVTSIGDDAFSRCYNLTSAYFLGNAPSMKADVFYHCGCYNAVICSNFTVYYTVGATGFSNPWYEYPTAVFDPNATTTTTEPTTTTSEPSSTTTSVPTTTTSIDTTTTTSVIVTTTVPVSSTSTTIAPQCSLTVEKSLLLLRAGLFARLRRIVIKGTNSEWDKESEVTIDDIKILVQRLKDQETIIAWIIIPGKLIAKFEPGTKEVRVQTPGKDDCIGEIVIE